VASWQAGESPIPDYQEAYGPIFHGDSSGKINEAEKELMAAEEALGNSKSGYNSDDLFWIDPWSAHGQEVSAKLLPVTKDLRLHAEHAIELLARVRQENPELKEPDALTAMDLGARRLDLIGMKFELAQEIADSYARALAQQHDKAQQATVANALSEIGGNNGRCEDLRDAYSALKAEYSQVWLSENRPYWLNNVTVRYDLQIEKWQRRGEMFEDAVRDWDHGKGLPTASALGLPAPDQPGSAVQ
jgi:hypothetical protein